MKILVAYDGTLNSKDVLRYGLFRAKTTNGELNVLNALDIAGGMEYEGLLAEEMMRREMAVYLRDAQDIIAEAGKGVKVSFITAEGSPEKELLDFALDNKIDLILVPEKFARIGRNAPCHVSVVPKDFSTFKVLLVDDELAFVSALSKRLNLRKLRTDVVTSGEQAMEYVRRDAPDVMILDLRMPGMDGIEVLKETKKRNPELQVIILSGRETTSDREEAKKYGAFDFVNKPANVDSLAGKVKEAYWTKIEKPPQAFAIEE